MRYLVEKDGKLLVGKFCEVRPQVYRLRDSGLYKIVWNGKNYWFSSGEGFWGDDFIELRYVGNVIDDDPKCNDQECFVYDVDVNCFLSVHTDLGGCHENCMPRDYWYGYRIYSRGSSFRIAIDKYIIMTRKYGGIDVIDLVKKDVISFDREVNFSRIEEAAKKGLMDSLKTLCKLNRKYLGKYDLEDELYVDPEVDLEKLVSLLEDKHVQEDILSGESRAVLNLRAAINLMSTVELDERFSKFDITVYRIDDNVVIKHNKHTIIEFSNRVVTYIACREKEIEEIYILSFCRDNPLNEVLNNDSLKKWAVLLKSIGSDRIVI